MIPKSSIYYLKLWLLPHLGMILINIHQHLIPQAIKRQIYFVN